VAVARIQSVAQLDLARRAQLRRLTGNVPRHQDEAPQRGQRLLSTLAIPTTAAKADDRHLSGRIYRRGRGRPTCCHLPHENGAQRWPRTPAMSSVIGEVGTLVAAVGTETPSDPESESESEPESESESESGSESAPESASGSAPPSVSRQESGVPSAATQPACSNRSVGGRTRSRCRGRHRRPKASGRLRADRWRTGSTPTRRTGLRSDPGWPSRVGPTDGDRSPSRRPARGPARPRPRRRPRGHRVRHRSGHVRPS
jgi:hypothetical protein